MRSILIFLIIAGWTVGSAQDSLLTHEFPEIVVTATRSTIPLHDSPSPVEVVRVDLPSVIHGLTVADVLRQSSSVFLQDVGGGAALKTAFLRGTASQHLLVLVNGVRQNTFQNGLVDFSLFPLSDVQSIEIVRGGSSALYGADALGGVVNILTRRPKSPFEFRADGAVGSFDYGRWGLEGQGRVGGIGLLAGGSQEYGSDKFLFQHPAGGDSLRRNADFRKRRIYVHGDMPLGESSEVRLFSQILKSDRGVPGSLTFSSDSARQHDEDANVSMEFHTASSQIARFVVRGAFHYNYQTYIDPNPSYPLNSRYRNLYVAINPEAQFVLADNYRIMLGVEFDEGTLEGNDFTGRILRIQKSAYLSNELRLVSQREMFDLISLYGMIRYDDISDVDSDVMPKVGVNVRLARVGDVRLRASYGTSFRSPSFNDLYYVDVNNPDLRPEYSTSFDAGITSEFNDGNDRHKFELTYFDIRTRDRILFDLTASRPVNIGRVTSTGLEAKYHGRLFDNILEFGLSYSLTATIKKNKSPGDDPAFEKQLLYIPRHSANSFAALRLDPVRITLSHLLVGRRFTTNDHLSLLPEHHLFDAAVTTMLGWQQATIVLSAQVKNIFDRSYNVVPEYPMPGRSLRVGIGFGY